MALDNLSEQRIQETYQKLVQTEGGSFATGDGNPIGIVTDNETGSFAHKTAISGAFAPTSLSLQNRLTSAESELGNTLISGSFQIATEISGAFSETSASISLRLKTLEATEDHLHNGTVSGSVQIATEISGAFTAASSSFSSRLTTTESELGNTLLSGSAQIASEISGAFTTVSHSLQDRVATLESTEDHLHNGTVSSSAQIATDISGAFTETSHSLQNRITTTVTNTTNNTNNITVNTSNISSLTSATSSYLLNTTDTLTGDLTITGKLIAEQYIVSSSVTLITQSFSSGSTIFGDDTSDTHQFTGSILLSGSSIQLNGDSLLPFTATGISGSFVKASSSLASRLDGLEDNLEVTATGISGSFVAPSSSFSSRVTDLESTSASRAFNQITASGNISASGLLFISASTTASALNTLMYDTATGQVYYTGSYGGGGGGGGGTGAGFPFEGNAVITGSLIVSGAADQDIEIFNDILPGVTDEYTLGTSTKKWNAVFATNTFFGGIHEINLETTGIGQLQTGTVLVSKAGQMVPCDTQADALVMGVVTYGSDYPVIMGPEPVLVDGPIYEGDYIITSNRLGYGKAVPPDQIYEQQLFGKIIAQSLETNLSGGIIKAMIRKM